MNMVKEQDRDYQRALHYYEKAAYEGNSLAKYKLGRFMI